MKQIFTKNMTKFMAFSMMIFLSTTLFGQNQMDLPVTFEDATTDYDLIGFGGADSSYIVTDPTNAANTVARVYKNATAQIWAGTTVTDSASSGFATAIPFALGSTVMTVKVWSPDANIQVRLKVEDHNNNTITCETEATVTTAGQWQTLTFNFANPVAGTPGLNLTNTYDLASIFFNFGVDGATAGAKTYWFDDVMFVPGTGPTLNQMDLPVTFEDPMVNYSLVGFGGADSSYIVVDPTNASNTVARAHKNATAQLWAGTTITDSANSGLANAIPFVMGSTTMTLKVWSPDAGIPVRLKVEDFSNPTISVETEAMVTTAGQWETLTFDFANQATGTAAINFASAYNKASVFFNFGTDGATAGAKTYFFDDLEFGTVQPSALSITTEICGPPADTVRMTGPFWGWDPNAGPIAVDNGNGTWTFTLNPAPTADMEYLLIMDGVQENLIPIVQAGGTCAPVTDNATYANRLWATTDPLMISNTYGQCDPCGAAAGLNITIDICSPTADTVRMTGPFWGWDPNGGPLATDNGNGTWTVNLNPAPTANMEYLFLVDGVQENLVDDMINGGSCAPVTDYANYANRLWNVGDGDVTNIAFDRCVPCSYPDLIITTEVCDPIVATQVNLTGPLWGWNPAFGPQAVDNGDGTWTFTLSPAPSDSLEYLLVVDGVMENLIQAMIDSGDCAPLTDYATYANRLWANGDPATFSNTYGQCTTCATNSLTEASLSPVNVYPNPTSSTISISRAIKIETLTVYNMVGEKVLELNVNANNVEVDMSKMASGVYQLEVSGANTISRSKIIKE